MWRELEASDDGEAKLTGVTEEKRELCRTADADVKGFAVILEARGVSWKVSLGKSRRGRKEKRILSGPCLCHLARVSDLAGRRQ